ncbi:ABC transporter substrate-binding protein [Rufibacter sp. LB8]|uniref:ABC transporter substrate-binding protein n=1 Tax=Rufibacter sp. LB8 TaxID=2777781 RepID=UPI00178C1ABB|nr:ABC transporter substrate-binding protein [Rufibacter sp. LB8]
MNRIPFLALFSLLLWAISCSPKKADDSIRIRLAQDPESLHPLSYGNPYALQVLNLMYQSLLSVDLKDRSIQPALAVSLPTVTIQGDSSYFTYTLRPEARWDDGQPVTAQDVSFSIKVMHSPMVENERWRVQYAFIEDIRFSKDNPREFTLACAGYSPEMRHLTGDFFILPAHKLDPDNILKGHSLRLLKAEQDSLSNTPAIKKLAGQINTQMLARDTAWVKGSGPYRLMAWNTGQQLRLEKKSNWWGDKANNPSSALISKPQKLVYQIITDNAAALLALKANQIDVMDNIPLVPFLEMRKGTDYKENFAFFTTPTYDAVFMGVNGSKPILQDKRTRQALGHLLPVAQIINTLHGGYASPTAGFIPPQDSLFYNSNLKPLAYDIIAVKQLLQSAGWFKSPQGWRKKINGQQAFLQLELLHRAGNSDFENMALMFQQNAKRVGIPIILKPMEGSQISERLRTRDYDLYFRTLTGNPFSYNLLSLLHSQSAANEGANVTHFGTSESDQLLEQIAREENLNTKAILLKALQKIMREEANLMFLYFPKNKLAVSKRIDSVVVSSLEPGYDVTRLVLKK